MGRLLHIA